MTDDAKEMPWAAGWGLPASVGVHLCILALMIFGLPVDLLQAEAEKPIEVSLVPASAQEQPAAPEPPPPPAKTEETEQPEEAKANQAEAPIPPPPGEEVAQQTPPPEQVVAPVFQFGEQDGGSREALDGNSAEANDAEKAPAEETGEANLPVDTDQEGEEQAAAEQQAEAEQAPDTGQETQEENPAGQSILSANRSDDRDALVEEPAKPAVKPKESAKPKKAKLQKAKKLFSRSVTDNPVAITAMRNMPRDIRAGRLCVTELREQLLNAWPPYAPDLLPTERLRSGTVLDGAGAAFRQAGEWYELNFRCEVDKEAMRVVSFAFSVGDRLSQIERMRRGLPLQ